MKKKSSGLAALFLATGALLGGVGGVYYKDNAPPRIGGNKLPVKKSKMLLQCPSPLPQKPNGKGMSHSEFYFEHIAHGYIYSCSAWVCAGTPKSTMKKARTLNAQLCCWIDDNLHEDIMATGYFNAIEQTPITV